MSDAPGWFSRAIGTSPESHRIDVGGTSILYLAWGERDLPGIGLVHGGAAHAHWWDHIGPSFLPDYRVVALDLSGHGDSDRRAGYTLRAWTEEVAAVIDDAGFTSPPVVVGHSMGGFVTIATAAWQADRIAERDHRLPVQAEDPRLPKRAAPTSSRRRRPTTIQKSRSRDSARSRSSGTTCPTSRSTSPGTPSPCSTTAAGAGSSTRRSSSRVEPSRHSCSPRSPAGWRCCAASTGSSPPTSATTCTNNSVESRR